IPKKTDRLRMIAAIIIKKFLIRFAKSEGSVEGVECMGFSFMLILSKMIIIIDDFSVTKF
ncbi:MAG TPA: hypothetical protein DEF27_05480, partial [Oscillatoriales bacterium UBA8482]|nr:hypothetical protein [Oscillatoriales bacterium UBA8482]